MNFEPSQIPKLFAIMVYDLIDVLYAQRQHPFDIAVEVNATCGTLLTGLFVDRYLQYRHGSEPTTPSDREDLSEKLRQRMLAIATHQREAEAERIRGRSLRLALEANRSPRGVTKAVSGKWQLQPKETHV